MSKDTNVNAMPPIKMVSVVIPARHEQDTIGLVLDALNAAIAGMPRYQFETLVVVDSMDDLTVQVAEAKAKELEGWVERLKQELEQAKVRTYVVKAGDSLSKIAQQFYGDAKRWPEIYEANKSQIKDPNVIHPGQELRIP